MGKTPVHERKTTNCSLPEKSRMVKAPIFGQREGDLLSGATVVL
jgi:hypothetical protein